MVAHVSLHTFRHEKKKSNPFAHKNILFPRAKSIFRVQKSLPRAQGRGPGHMHYHLFLSHLVVEASELQPSATKHQSCQNRVLLGRCTVGPLWT